MSFTLQRHPCVEGGIHIHPTQRLKSCGCEGKCCSAAGKRKGCDTSHLPHEHCTSFQVSSSNIHDCAHVALFNLLLTPFKHQMLLRKFCGPEGGKTDLSRHDSYTFFFFFLSLFLHSPLTYRRILMSRHCYLCKYAYVIFWLVIVHDEHLVNKHILTLVMTHAAWADRRRFWQKYSEQAKKVPDISDFFFFFFAEGTHCQREASFFTTKP